MMIRANLDHELLRRQAKQVRPGRRVHQIGLRTTSALGQSCPPQFLEAQLSLGASRPRVVLAKMGEEQVRKPRLLHQ
jgi:hypothetical protein